MSGSTLNQYIAAIIINISALSLGTTIGWVSPVLEVLQNSTMTPLDKPMTDDDASWVGSLLFLTATVGTMIYGYLGDTIGRKTSGVLCAVPLVVSWLLIIFATNVKYIIVSRVLAGIGGGGVLTVVPTYISEISDTRIRGRLGVFLTVGVNVGILAAFILGSYVPYYTLAYILGVIPLLALILGFCVLPESPEFLLCKKRPEKAKKSFEWLHGKELQVQEAELTTLNPVDEKHVEDEFVEEKKNPIVLLVNSSVAIKGMFLATLMFLFQQCSGTFAVISYSSIIFKESGTFSPEIGTILCGILQLIGSMISSLIIEKTGRKILMVSSCIGLAICMCTLGTFDYLKYTGHDVSAVGWIPVLSLSLSLFVYSSGLGPVPYVIVSEIFEAEVRGIATSISIFMFWIFAFLICKLFPALEVIMGNYGVFFLFTGCMIVGGLFIWFCLPETKGRSTEDIVTQMKTQWNMS